MIGFLRKPFTKKDYLTGKISQYHKEQDESAQEPDYSPYILRQYEDLIEYVCEEYKPGFHREYYRFKSEKQLP